MNHVSHWKGVLGKGKGPGISVHLMCFGDRELGRKATSVQSIGLNAKWEIDDGGRAKGEAIRSQIK